MDTSGHQAVFEALRRRRSIGRVKPDPVDHATISRLIDAATWAPNHHRTEPWRFVVVTGDARIALGEVMAQSLLASLDDAPDERAVGQIDKERNKPLRAPVIVAVAALPSPDPKNVEVEEIAAVAAAVQNMLLAAEALGLGAIWRTGAAAYDPAVKEFLGLPAQAHLLALVYLGYPEYVPPRDRYGNADPYTTWLD